jgi:fumarate reductase flavoprotein subunit
MAPTVKEPPQKFDFTVETLIVGAGACGLIAALSAMEAGQEVLVIEADAVPSGSTALSAGLIPAAGTKIQQAAGIKDSTALFAADIQAKAHQENNQVLVDLLAQNAAEVIDWLTQTHGLAFSLVDDFDYPGVAALRPDGGIETIGCDRLILACNGFGGNRALVSEHMPEIENGLWFGHDGNRGEAVLWASQIGAATEHLGAFQGHGNVAHPHGILITWATITEGGVQVNAAGERFWNEAQGYSEAARAVLSQAQGVAYAIFDGRIAEIAEQFEDFKRAKSEGAIKSSGTLEGLAQALGLPADTLSKTIAEISPNGTDRFGRSFGETLLSPPYCGVRVTGALFHTQGGLQVDASARVIRKNGGVISNLYAGGGAACGVSGSGDRGYLSGNGLLAAAVLGRIAGSAARG